jgi:hypothetical protein
MVLQITVISMIRSRRMRWAEHVARMGEMRNALKILVGKSGGDHSETKAFW